MSGRGAAFASWIVGLALLAQSPALRADEFRPAYLQLTQVDPTTYDVLWKLPAPDESTTLKVRPAFPDGTDALTAIRGTYAAGTAVQRSCIRMAGGLDGKAVTFTGLSTARVDILVLLIAVMAVGSRLACRRQAGCGASPRTPSAAWRPTGCSSGSLPSEARSPPSPNKPADLRSRSGVQAEGHAGR